MAGASVNLLHLSDLHFGEESVVGVNSVSNLQSFLAEVVDRRIAIDACIVTGDLAHLGQEWAYERLVRLLNSAPWPTRVVPGNHDEIAVGRRILGSRYWPPDPVWTWQISEKFRVVGLTTSVPGHHHGELSGDRLTEFREAARDASSSGRWVVALHHPPVDVGHWWMDAQGLLAGRKEFLALCEEFRPAAVLCGHVHVTSWIQRGKLQIIVAPSTAHEVVYDDGLERPLRFRPRSPRALLHRFGDDQVVTVELTSSGTSWLVNGRPWEDEVRRTNERGPAMKHD